MGLYGRSSRDTQGQAAVFRSKRERVSLTLELQQRLIDFSRRVEQVKSDALNWQFYTERERVPDLKSQFRIDHEALDPAGCQLGWERTRWWVLVMVGAGRRSATRCPRCWGRAKCSVEEAPKQPLTRSEPRFFGAYEEKQEEAIRQRRSKR